VVARPGLERGSVTRAKAWSGPARSMAAASSSERGIPSKNVRIIHITSDRLKVR